MDYSLFNSLNSAKTLSAADKANFFTERMSSTAHQREVEDLQRAGLNPVLSADSSGATTGSAAEDDSESTTSNPIYKLVNTVNKATNTNAKSLSEATSNLTKNLGKMTSKVTELMEDVVDDSQGLKKEWLKKDTDLTSNQTLLTKDELSYLTSAIMKNISDSQSGNTSAKGGSGIKKAISNLDKVANAIVDSIVVSTDDAGKNNNGTLFGSGGKSVLTVLPNFIKTRISNIANSNNVNVGKTLDNMDTVKSLIPTFIYGTAKTVFNKIKNALIK